MPPKKEEEESSTADSQRPVGTPPHASPPTTQPVEDHNGLEQYRATVDICAQFKLDANLPNGFSGNASILFSAFFKWAQEQVCIYTGNLFGGVFDVETDVVQQAIKFLRKDPKNRLQIALSDKVDFKEFMLKPFISSIMREPDIKGRLAVYDASGIAASNHFTVMDQSAFRFETSHAHKHAVANFGHPAKAERLYNEFKAIILCLPPVNLDYYLKPPS